MRDKRTEIIHIIKDTRSLLTIPGIIDKLSSLAGDGWVSVGELARVVATDQVLSAKVLKFVNSPFNGFSGRISTGRCRGRFCRAYRRRDFVFIVPLDRAEPVCKTVIANFNIIVSDPFGDDENASGYYMAKDRKGNEQKFFPLGIAIAVVPVNFFKTKHYGKIAEVAAELKKLAKKSPESTYVVDQRRT